MTKPADQQRVCDFCGERGIRTPGGVTLNGFQDRRNRPLCHLSGCKIKVCGGNGQILTTLRANIFDGGKPGTGGGGQAPFFGGWFVNLHKSEGLKHLKAVNKYFWKYRWRFLLGLVFIILSNYFRI